MPSNLKENKILLIGRGREKMKRFDLGIQAMEYIKDVLSDSKLMIIAKNKSLDNLINTVNNLNLNNNIEFAMYSSDPSIYFNSASLNFLTSLSESYSLSLSETKIFGIPTIIMGLDFLSLSKKGTIIIYDDYPETLAKISLKILLNNVLKKKLSIEARQSMKNLSNEILKKDWKKLLILSYNDFTNYTKYFIKRRHKDNYYLQILRKQIDLLKSRTIKMKNINISFIFNLTNIIF
jgi:hypothetical protein